jgi:hypothetical protein
MPEWDGATLRTTYKEGYQAKRDALADAARDGDWPEVFTRLDEHPGLLNTGPPGTAPTSRSCTGCSPTAHG